MTRALSASLLSLCLVLAACNKTEDAAGVDVDTPSTGGKGGSIKSDPPAATGGKTGSGGSAGGAASGGAGPSGGSSGSGGGATSGSGGSAGAGPSDAADGPSANDGSNGTTPDAGAPATPSDGGFGVLPDGGFGGDILPGRPYIHLCKKEWTQAQCCEFLCSCLSANCTDSPMDNARIPMCMSMCTKLTDFRARCQVFHCFESKSPTAVKDHASHCGHASGRVGGGSCTAIMP